MRHILFNYSFNPMTAKKAIKIRNKRLEAESRKQNNLFYLIPALFLAVIFVISFVRF